MESVFSRYHFCGILITGIIFALLSAGRSAAIWAFWRPPAHNRFDEDFDAWEIAACLHSSAKSLREDGWFFWHAGSLSRRLYK
jgi:hypothetical protein